MTPEGDAALTRLADRILAGARLHVPVEMEVIRSDQVNAFAAPGGRIAILSGLLETASGPDQVAAVLAHELGHVAHRDGLRAILRAAGTQGALTLFLGDLAGGSLSALTQLALAASYSREMEREADEYAHARLAAAGIPTAALARFFRTTPEFWANMQVGYDLKRRAAAKADELAAIPEIEAA